MCLTQKSADVVVMDISHKIRKQPFVMRFNKPEYTLGTTKVFNLVQVDDSDEVPLPVNVAELGWNVDIRFAEGKDDGAAVAVKASRHTATRHGGKMSLDYPPSLPFPVQSSGI
ncbi:hypothetical protein MY4824_006040 [Beauveria thailandica]